MNYSAHSRYSRFMPVGIIAMLVSGCFSVFVINAHPILNDDAYSYLHAAEMFDRDGARAMLGEYPWYGYSILIALFDRFIPGNLLSAAHVVDTLGFMVLTLAFIKVCAELTPGRYVSWFAALTILGFPLVNELRYYLIRDTWFWAASMAGLWFLLRFCRSGKIADASGWSLFALLAVVFRLEGLVIALFAPLALLFTGQGRETRVRAFGILATMQVVVLLACFLAALLMHISLTQLIGHAYRYYLAGLQHVGGNFLAAARQLLLATFPEQGFPGHASPLFGGLLLFLDYLLVIALNLVTAFSLPLVLLLSWGAWRRQLQVARELRTILYTYLLCTLTVLVVFQFIMHFQTERYAALFCLLLLTQVPQLLEKLYEHAIRHGTLRRYGIIMGLFCIYYFGDSLISFSYEKTYMVDAIQWTRANLPQDGKLVTNDYALAYGSGRVADYDRVSPQIDAALNAAGPGDFLMVLVQATNKAGHSLLDGDSRLHELMHFSNIYGDEVRIYRVSAGAG